MLLVRINPLDEVPRWAWIALGVAVVGAVAWEATHREPATPKVVYYYWAEPRIGDFGTEWVPMIQQQSTTDVFAMAPQITEAGALWIARGEIEDRGGEPFQGKPVA